MKNIKLTVEYDGTNYHGWQIQSHVPTVQGELEKAIYELTGEETSVNGCSRTDRGVHALNHISNFLTASSIPPERFFMALNTKLPDDIVVRSSCEMPPGFHARFCASGKKYIYKILNAPVASALNRNRVWHVQRELDVAAMKEAVKHYIGTHDFTAFQAVGSEVESTVKTIIKADVFSTGSFKTGDCEIIFEVSGDGFLYNMVRIMAGTLVYVGLAKILPEDIPVIIESCNRKKAGITAPPQGLYLAEVYY